MDRSSQIIKTSIVGIVANVLLAVFKAVVGILASSVAIVMDAVNNLSDALSSVITIVGTRLSQRPADRQHPFGFGRIEYFSAIIIRMYYKAFSTGKFGYAAALSFVMALSLGLLAIVQFRMMRNRDA